MLYPPITYPPAPDDDDFDERLDGQREAGLGDGPSLEAAAEPSPEEPDRD